MKTVPFTDFRKNASVFINEVEHGETLILIRHGKPVAEIVPFLNRLQKLPAKCNGTGSVYHSGSGNCFRP